MVDSMMTPANMAGLYNTLPTTSERCRIDLQEHVSLMNACIAQGDELGAEVCLDIILHLRYRFLICDNSELIPEDFCFVRSYELRFPELKYQVVHSETSTSVGQSLDDGCESSRSVECIDPPKQKRKRRKKKRLIVSDDNDSCHDPHCDSLVTRTDNIVCRNSLKTKCVSLRCRDIVKDSTQYVDAVSYQRDEYQPPLFNKGFVPRATLQSMYDWSDAFKQGHKWYHRAYQGDGDALKWYRAISVFQNADVIHSFCDSRMLSLLGLYCDSLYGGRDFTVCRWSRRDQGSGPPMLSMLALRKYAERPSRE